MGKALTFVKNESVNSVPEHMPAALSWRFPPLRAEGIHGESMTQAKAPPMRNVVTLCLAVFALLAGPVLAEEADRAVVGRFLLTDMTGRPVTDEAYGGKIRRVVFGYTSCPEI